MKDSQTFALAQLSWADLTGGNGYMSMAYVIGVQAEIERRHNQADVLCMRRLGNTKGHFGEVLPIHPPMDSSYYPHH